MEKTEQEERREATTTALSKADHLFLVMECTRPQAGGMRCNLSQVTEVIFQRGEERSLIRETCPGGERLFLRVPDRRMSGEHARLLRTDQGFVLQDSQSTNGTVLNGTPTQRAAIRDGALFELGRTLFGYREQLPTPRQLPLDVDAEAPVPVAEGPLLQSTLHPCVAADLQLLQRISRSTMPVLLLGETGTGKEVLTRMIHAESGRQGDLVAVNCGAIPRDLVASSLFGHRRGAFSGATEDAPGYFRAAHRGTLLLDEIGDLPADSQVALLRVLQEREVVPVGSTRAIPVDVRVIAATHAPLPDLVTNGSFRADLLNRLAGHTHRLPPLRERREDIGLLIANMVSELPDGDALRLTPLAGRALMRYAYPGNARELYQVLARAIVLQGDEPVDVAHLPNEMAACAQASFEPPSSAGEHELSAEDRLLLKRLEAELIAHHGNVTKVAEAMGKQRMQIQRWLKRFDLDAAQYRRRKPSDSQEG